jgi:sugar lactone lactonase YvrE
MTSAGTEAVERRGRGTRVLLLVAVAILLAVLIGILYLLWSMVNLPERQPVLATQPGVSVAFQSFGGAFGRLDHPLGVAYDRRNDKIYVTEPVSARVLVFDGDGQNGRMFAQDESREDSRVPAAVGTVSSPEGVDVGPDGSVYVADPVKGAVLVFSPTGRRLRAMKFTKPIRVTVAGNRLYVLTGGTLVVTDLQGNLLNRFGTEGKGPDNLYGPTGVAVDAKRNAYISDSENFRIVALTADLKPLWSFGQPGSSESSMNARPIGLPTGVTLGADGNLYAVDGMGGQIMVFSPSGAPISAALSSRGAADNQLGLPQTIYWMKDNLFVIADQGHNRIVGFRLTPQPLSTRR